jgi:hypothetical protein
MGTGAPDRVDMNDTRPVIGEVIVSTGPAAAAIARTPAPTASAGVSGARRLGESEEAGEQHGRRERESCAAGARQGHGVLPCAVTV